MPMTHLCPSLPEDLLWLREDAVPPVPLGQVRCWEALAPGAALNGRRTGVGNEDLASYPLEQNKACVSQPPGAPQWHGVPTATGVFCSPSTLCSSSSFLSAHPRWCFL